MVGLLNVIEGLKRWFKTVKSVRSAGLYISLDVFPCWPVMIFQPLPKRVFWVTNRVYRYPYIAPGVDSTIKTKWMMDIAKHWAGPPGSPGGAPKNINIEGECCCCVVIDVFASSLFSDNTRIIYGWAQFFTPILSAYVTAQVFIIAPQSNPSQTCLKMKKVNLNWIRYLSSLS